jgi:hypothetical protein
VRTRKLNEKYSSLCQEKNSGRPWMRYSGSLTVKSQEIR